ncbi:zinc-dependent metalloprotease [Maricaulaceae bacterium EIL42A08]|nr:zinc-dependent metalloprotease [Maricaulaceae bacterium EIL42A08]
MTLQVLTRFGVALLTLALLATASGNAQSDADFDSLTADAERREGVFDLFVDEDAETIHAAFPASDTPVIARYIYTARLTAGLGSNPVGLDRGFGIGGNILRIERVGGRVHFIFENPNFRAIGAGEDETLATRQSFAESVIWAGDVAAVSDAGEVLVDLSGFLVTDRIDVIGRLRSADEGSFSIDTGRSAPLLDQALAFPRNVEIDARLTLSTSQPGSEVRSVTPDPRSVSLVQHHSFVALPEPGYEPRRADIRSGGFESEFRNTAAPLEQPMRDSYAVRHRLQRVDPNAASGPVVEPIVFYVDRGAPEPVRSALIEGASWWAEAFEAAGFEDAYRVEVLPEGAHLLDVRYNTIQWVHRETRGWSYGASVTDPRTGEIIKGAVILGSQRVRQDRMIFEGLAGAAQTGSGTENDPIEVALARLRQLSAHEVGHTLGLAHNFAASADGRASVMDYPHPLVRLLETGDLDFSEAYDVGIGDWDKVSVSWLYGQFPEGADEDAALEQILADARADGLRYVSDAHARGPGAAFPEASLWDNGEDPVAHLSEVIDVRAAALAGFGADRLGEGRAMSELKLVFTPIYLYHRYQTEAAARGVGGRRFAYEINDGRAQGISIIPAAEQRTALNVVLQTLEPAFLDTPDDAARLMAPDPFTDYDGAIRRERIGSTASPAFSRIDAARSAARITLAALLAPEKLARVADQHAIESQQLGLIEVFDAVEATVFNAPRSEAARLTSLREGVQIEYAAQLLHLVEHGAPRVAAEARARLEGLGASRGGMFGRSPTAHQRWLANTARAGLQRLDRGESVSPPAAPIPPGSPIGLASEDSFH